VNAKSHWGRLKYFGVLPYGYCETCGWEGPTRDYERDAADDARRHERETGPMSGYDLDGGALPDVASRGTGPTDLMDDTNDEPQPEPEEPTPEPEPDTS
jgi:hypothetical protein